MRHAINRVAQMTCMRKIEVNGTGMKVEGLMHIRFDIVRERMFHVAELHEDQLDYVIQQMDAEGVNQINSANRTFETSGTLSSLGYRDDYKSLAPFASVVRPRYNYPNEGVDDYMIQQTVTLSILQRCFLVIVTQ